MKGITSVFLTLLIHVTWHHGESLSDDEFPIVTIAQGALKGQRVVQDNVSPYYRFLGIPYAKPPLGDLRFKAPVAPEPWNGTRDALEEGSMCKQPVTVGRELQIGDEDCLFLNVFTPQLNDSDSLTPVMVWIHGGGFLLGTGGLQYQGPQYLVNEGVVVVSLNYRLGIFGFLSTEDEVVPGNAGLKDQVMALRWVQENIAAFGGDPDQVTLFGESAGGVSVNYHMLSPMSEGLFHRGIAQSGSTYCTWAQQNDPRGYAFLVGDYLGFSGNSSEELVEFLRNTTATDLVTASYFTLNEVDYIRLMNVFHLMPSIEPVVEGEPNFITEQPFTLLEQGRFQKMPLISGVTNAEGLYLVGVGVIAPQRPLEEIDENFVKIFKPELRVCKDQPCGDELIAKAKSFYFGDQPLNNDTIWGLINMETDLNFDECVIYGVKKMSEQTSEPMYLYEFIYDGTLGFVKMTIPGVDSFPGAAHGDELGYLFDMGVEVHPNHIDLQVRSFMVTLWTNFAKTGNPTPNPNTTAGYPEWLPYTTNVTNYYQIGASLAPFTDLLKYRMDFWEDLYDSVQNMTYV